jgi:hypothetical protein
MKRCGVVVVDVVLPSPLCRLRDGISFPARASFHTGVTAAVIDKEESADAATPARLTPPTAP